MRRRAIKWGLLVVLILIAIAAAMTFAGSKSHATSTAKEHAKELGWKTTGFACAGTDTDGDGYISCTVATEECGEKHLDCDSGSWLYGPMTDGCRARMVKLGGEG